MKAASNFLSYLNLFLRNGNNRNAWAKQEQLSNLNKVMHHRPHQQEY